MRSPTCSYVAGLFALGASLFAPSAHATRSFVTLHDDGTLAAPSNVSVPALTDYVVKLYEGTGKPIPDVLSVWTTFSMDGSPYETLYNPVANEVTGLGLQSYYGGDGTFASTAPPLNAILLHNDVTQLDARAKIQGASSTDGFAQYLFLLEFFHQWGPTLAVPATDAGGSQDLVGFLFHWSFWMSAGGSPAGGNAWKDNGDGTFTVSGQSPAAVRYTMLDLYMMGLASKGEVSPFGVLENVVPPAGLTDPLWNGPYSAKSFPWFGSTPFTATATMRGLTIEDVVAANGARAPDFSSSPKSWTVGVVLFVPASATAAEIATDEALMEPIAASYPSTFKAATGGRGTIDLVTVTNESDAGAGDAAPPHDAGKGASRDAGNHASAPSGAESSGGCAVARDAGAGARGFSFFLGLGAALLGLGARRKRGALQKH
jgi:hypothetical protein